MGRCRQSDIVSSFGVSVDSVARSVKPYKEKVESGFFGPDGRMLIKELLQTDADILPDYKDNTLTIMIHSLDTPRANKAVESLCVLFNETKTDFSNTNLKMIFKISSANQENGIFLM